MKRRLPPLKSLQAFEAAARHLSFKKAADELAVTPAAISQQVKRLEEFYGVSLFRRRTRALALTDMGRSVLLPLSEGFDHLARAASLLASDESDRVVSVSVAPSFGAKWLVPRLPRFRAAHPDLDIRIDATDSLADFETDGIDVALRYGTGVYDGMTAECLMDDFVVPVCSPSLLNEGAGIREPDDLRHHTLLHIQWMMEREDEPNWRMWLQAAGIRDLDGDKGPVFSHEGVALAAALEGQGVALASASLVQDDLQAGRLVQLFPPDIRQVTAFCYYVVYPTETADRPKVKAFRDWVMGEGGLGGVVPDEQNR